MNKILHVFFIAQFLAHTSFAAPVFFELQPRPLLDQTAPEKPKSRDEHFKDVNLTFNRLNPALSTKNCYQKIEKFMGCYYAINAALSAFADQTEFFSEKHLANPKYKDLVFTKIKEFNFIGAYSYAENSETVVTDEISEFHMAEYVKEIQENKKNNVKLLRELYQSSQRKKIQFESILQWINETYVSKQKDKESSATANALNSYLEVVYDPHTSLEPMQFWIDMQNTSETSFYGIGILFMIQKGVVIIKTPLKGSPALKAGLRANDQILEVDGVSFTEENMSKTIESMKGPEGTKVKLKIKRGEEISEIEVTRGKVVHKNVDYYEVSDLSNKKMGYLQLNDFSSEIACEQVYQALKFFDSKKVSGLIFDLRKNGGGSLEIGVCISTLFIGPDKLVVTRKSLLPGVPNQKENSGINSKFHPTIDKKYLNKLPMVTLIDSRSASASEIVAGVLQDYKRSIIVGERSYGKATVQTLSGYLQWPAMYDPFNEKVLESGEKADSNGRQGIGRTILDQSMLDSDEKLALKLTIQRFYLPSGRTNQIVGIIPEVEAFHTPHPTEDDRAAMREGDEYASLPALGEPYQDMRPEYSAKIRSCLTTGAAKQSFEKKQNDAIAPDYPVLVGQETLACMLSAQ